MSDVIRSYSSSGRGTYEAAPMRGRWFRRLLAAVIFAGAIWLYWTTRDTYPIERLVPVIRHFIFRRITCFLRV